MDVGRQAELRKLCVLSLLLYSFSTLIQTTATFLSPWFSVLMVFSRVCLPQCFSVFVLFGLTLLPSKLSSIVQLLPEITSHCRITAFHKSLSQSLLSTTTIKIVDTVKIRSPLYLYSVRLHPTFVKPLPHYPCLNLYTTMKYSSWVTH